MSKSYRNYKKFTKILINLHSNKSRISILERERERERERDKWTEKHFQIFI